MGLSTRGLAAVAGSVASPSAWFPDGSERLNERAADFLQEWRAIEGEIVIKCKNCKEM